MKIRYAPLAVACALMVAASAQAAAVTYNFGGTLWRVIDLPSLSVGGAYSGSFTYETTALDANSDPSIGSYPTGFSVNVTVNGYSFSSSTSMSDPAYGGISVADSSGAFATDYLVVATTAFGAGTGSPVIGPQLNGLAPFSLEQDLGGPSTLYNSDALPSNLVLSLFTFDQNFRFRFSNDGGFSNGIADGTTTYLTLATAPPVPEASTTAMLALGLSALAVARRQKNH